MRHEPKDSLGRRKRSADPQSTGARIVAGETGLLTFLHLENHGPLSIDYLLALMSPVTTNRNGYTKRLCAFFNEDNAEHGGRYIYKPWQQNQTEDPLAQTIIYDNTPRAWQILADAGLIEARPANHFHDMNNLWHQNMVACITASIELACREAGLKFIHKREILNGKALSIDVPVTLGKETHDGPLQPDGLFAIEYPDGKVFFFVEADRDTEGVSTKSLKVKSYRRKLLQYRKLMSEGLYKEFLDAEDGDGALCLHVTTSQKHMQTMIDALTSLSDGKGNSYNLFKCDPDFGRVPRISPPKLSYATEAWARSVHKPLNILKPW